MKCGIFTWFGYVLPFADRLSLIKDAGFDSICTWWADTFSDMDGRKEDHFEMAFKAGLRLEHTHLPYFGCDVLWKDGIDGNDLEKEYRNAIENAAKCGVSTVVLHPYDNKEVTQSNGWDVFMPRMARIVDTAQHAGVRLALENLQESHVIRRILTLLGDNENVGICFDSGHGNISDHGDFSVLTEYPDKIYALHLHDNDGVHDQHLLPYEGNINWNTFMSALEYIDFGGSFMLEASYPFDFEKADRSSDMCYIPPPIPPEEYLSQAMCACLKVLEQTP